VGLVPEGIRISASGVCAGDHVIVSGSIADHGMAIMSVREGMEFEGAIHSDTTPLHSLVAAMLNAGEVHALRDPTRGGLGTSLSEIAASSSIGVEIDANLLLVRPAVKGACELLGIDPLFVANEGKLVAFVAPASSEAVVRAMRNLPEGRDARVVGHASAHHPGMVLLKTEIGGRRILDLPFTEQLPRIC
jgi:hydrogenase expression/formation protein HypE